ncbi:hypothetical protein RchiOBHm_Chr7g0234021 [Rosa chinensis]|uniref:Uncharacterized protein n=1 Tax=Rosa chinensis TaxID=74649 RepID=A0A2P6PGB0_ROSCH|nr:hypothetical protein RchiOBHm_Chr7g0234021 [Rosa chinensis]
MYRRVVSPFLLQLTTHSKFFRFVVRTAYPTESTSREVIWQGNLSNKELSLEVSDFVEVQ